MTESALTRADRCAPAKRLNGWGSGRVASGGTDLTRPRLQNAVRYVKLVMGVFGPLEVLLGASGPHFGAFLGLWRCFWEPERRKREERRDNKEKREKREEREEREERRERRERREYESNV